MKLNNLINHICVFFFCVISDGDENKENICGWLISAYNTRRCQKLFWTIWNGKFCSNLLYPFKCIMIYVLLWKIPFKIDNRSYCFYALSISLTFHEILKLLVLENIINTLCSIPTNVSTYLVFWHYVCVCVCV